MTGLSMTTRAPWLQQSGAIFFLKLAKRHRCIDQCLAYVLGVHNTRARTTIKELAIDLATLTNSLSRNLNIAARCSEHECQVRVRRRLAQVRIDHHDRVICQPARDGVVDFLGWRSASEIARISHQLDNLAKAFFPIVDSLLSLSDLSESRSSCGSSVNSNCQGCRRNNRDDRPHRLNPRGPISSAVNDLNWNAHGVNPVTILDSLVTQASRRGGEA